MHFQGLLPPNGILPGANSLCVQVLRSPILAALLHGTRASAVGVSQTLWRGTRNMELRNFRSSLFSVPYSESPLTEFRPGGKFTADGKSKTNAFDYVSIA